MSDDIIMDDSGNDLNASPSFMDSVEEHYNEILDEEEGVEYEDSEEVDYESSEEEYEEGYEEADYEEDEEDDIPYVTHEDFNQLNQRISQQNELTNRFFQLIGERLLTEEEEPEAAPPDPENEPVDAMFYRLNNLSDSVQNLSERLDAEKTESNYREYVEGLTNFINTTQEVVMSDESEYYIPDYEQARDFLINSLAEDIRYSNPGTTEEELEAAMADYMMDIINDVRSKGEFFPFYLYKWAQTRGYEAPEYEEEYEEEGEEYEDEDSSVAIFEEEKRKLRSKPSSGSRLPSRTGRRRAIDSDIEDMEDIAGLDQEHFNERYEGASLSQIIRDFKRMSVG